MRGNHEVGNPARAAIRSIPAYAGEPHCSPLSPRQRRVYPRVCGGTVGRLAAADAQRRLSPRMRGNQHRRLRRQRAKPSIPAYAGEPYSVQNIQRTACVYPRVCGGTSPSSHALNSALGLSPRMRGNPIRRRGNDQIHRSIPAYAGEPTSHPRAVPRGRVYPRVCGGTRRLELLGFAAQGLSPRMRGNHGRAVQAFNASRSIPAYAGEPRPGRPWPFRTAVYPRVCGGTVGTLDCH